MGLFAGLSLGGIAFVRPAVKHALGIESRAQDTRALAGLHVAGQRAIVTQAVGSSSGRVRIGEGEFWTARSFDPSQTLEPGEAAEVVLVDGLTALVEPIRSGTDDYGQSGIEAPEAKILAQNATGGTEC